MKTILMGLAPVLLALTLSSCLCSRATRPSSTSSPPAADPTLCPSVCTHYRALGCAAGTPTPEPNSVSCEVVCKSAIEAGMVRWNMPCRASASSCEAAEACER